jgi:hypothetical protein
MIAFPYIDRIVCGTLAAAELDFLCETTMAARPEPCQPLGGICRNFFEWPFNPAGAAQSERAPPPWQSPPEFH